MREARQIRKKRKPRKLYDSDYLIGVYAHYMERTFSLNWLAEEMKLNPNYLSTRFKKETGVGFVRYVNQL